MKALCWHGKHDIRSDTVPDPGIEDPRDAIIKMTSCAICGSDLHLFNGFVPGMMSGDIIGHEFMGEVVEVGSANKKLKVGDRVVVPFTIICGECEQCRRGNFSVCERTNRKKKIGDMAFGHTTAGLFGYTHLTGGYAGGQAEYIRVPYADVGPSANSRWIERRASFVSWRYFPHWMAGCRSMRYSSNGHGGGVGCRARWPVRDSQRPVAGCSANRRH